MDENPYQSPKELDSRPKASPRNLLRLIFLVGGGVLVGWLFAAGIASELLTTFSLGPQLGLLAMLVLFLVAMVGGGVAGAWLANRGQAAKNPLLPSEQEES
jgi:hypothetical protein